MTVFLFLISGCRLFGNSRNLDIISDILYIFVWILKLLARPWILSHLCGFFVCFCFCFQCPSCSNKCAGLCNLLYWCFEVIFSRKYHLIILFLIFDNSFLKCITFFPHKCYLTWGLLFWAQFNLTFGWPFLGYPQFIRCSISICEAYPTFSSF